MDEELRMVRRRASGMWPAYSKTRMGGQALCSAARREIVDANATAAIAPPLPSLQQPRLRPNFQQQASTLEGGRNQRREFRALFYIH